MAKRKLKEIIEHIEAEGFKEVGRNEKNTEWYKRASQKPDCLTAKASKHSAHMTTKA
ncbi:MAG: hypothetical protein HY035_04215 [Nitrospirae bacterium]|nr:hypothetical protein [Nitrospirota bacterium]MBI3377593.1 hypothetical protein [Nitrospirota bacterium]